jgi:dTDP-4-amino-4,6-dideoxygalactose transaminase
VLEVARRHGLQVIEDAAHALGSSLGGRPLGTLGSLAALSFHETKNVICGEGGALIVNDPALVERAEIVQEKGTNRRAFHRGQVDKYTWVDVGSSFPASELAAAFLWAQLERFDWLTTRRLAVWERYHEGFLGLEEVGAFRRPVVPPNATHNGHIYYLLLPSETRRDELLAELALRDVNSVFHYVPLHSSTAGRRYGRATGELPVTDRVSARLLRLPVWVGMTDAQIEHVIASVHQILA